MAVLTALQFEERLNRYLYERAEEARAVRVGEKETSEQAEIVARYADLFTRGQHESLRDELRGAVGRLRVARLTRRGEHDLGAYSSGCLDHVHRAVDVHLRRPHRF